MQEAEEEDEGAGPGDEDAVGYEVRPLHDKKLLPLGPYSGTIWWP